MGTFWLILEEGKEMLFDYANANDAYIHMYIL